MGSGKPWKILALRRSRSDLCREVKELKEGMMEAGRTGGCEGESWGLGLRCEQQGAEGANPSALLVAAGASLGGPETASSDSRRKRLQCLAGKALSS